MEDTNFGDKRNTNGFDKRPEDINKGGRPKKLISSVLAELKDKGYERITPAQVNEVYEYLLSLPLDELTEMHNDENSSYILKAVIGEMIKGRKFEIVERMLDRAHGKSIAKTEITGKDGEGVILILRDGDKV